MRAGIAYTADPVVFSGDICFETEDGAPMGSVCITSSERVEKICFRADKIKRGSTLNWIVNGEKEKEITLTQDAVSSEIEITVSLPVGFARVEIYDKNQRLLLLTNPIYFVREDLTDLKIPKERAFRL